MSKASLEVWRVGDGKERVDRCFWDGSNCFKLAGQAYHNLSALKTIKLLGGKGHKYDGLGTNRVVSELQRNDNSRGGKVNNTTNNNLKVVTL